MSEVMKEYKRPRHLILKMTPVGTQTAQIRLDSAELLGIMGFGVERGIDVIKVSLTFCTSLASNVAYTFLLQFCQPIKPAFKLS